MTREEIDEKIANLTITKGFGFIGYGPTSSVGAAMVVLRAFAEELHPSIVWSEESGGWQVKLEGAQMEYCAKDDLAIGICRAIVAAKRL